MRHNLGCVSLRSTYARYLRTVILRQYVATNCTYKQTRAKLGIAKSYRLFNPTYTPWGVRRSTYSFLLYAHPYVHVDSLWKWCTTHRRFTCDLGAFGSVTYYLGLVRGVADVSESHPSIVSICWLMSQLNQVWSQFTVIYKMHTSVPRTLRSDNI